MCYIPPLLSQFSFLRFSVQLERRCSLPRHAFPRSRLVFPRGIRNFLAITYSDNFRKTCHFQIAWTPAILFSAILVFPLTSTIEGRCWRPSTVTRRTKGLFTWREGAPANRATRGGLTSRTFENASKRLHARQGSPPTRGTLSTCPRHPAGWGSFLP